MTYLILAFLVGLVWLAYELWTAPVRNDWP
jgi:hypothetical protein